MSYTAAELENKVQRYECCLSNITYKLGKSEERGAEDTECLRNNSLYLNQGINILSKYEPVESISTQTGTIDLTSFLDAGDTVYYFSIEINGTLVTESSANYPNKAAFLDAVVILINSLNLGFTTSINGNILTLTATNLEEDTTFNIVLSVTAISIVNMLTHTSGVEYTFTPTGGVNYGCYAASDGKYYYGTTQGISACTYAAQSTLIASPASNVFSNQLFYIAGSQVIVTPDSNGNWYTLDVNPLSGGYQTFTDLLVNYQANFLFLNLSGDNCFYAPDSSAGLMIVIDTGAAFVASISDADFYNMGMNYNFIDFYNGNPYICIKNSNKIVVLDGNSGNPTYNTVINKFDTVLPPTNIKLIDGYFYISMSDGTQHKITKMSPQGVFSNTIDVPSPITFLGGKSDLLYSIYDNSTLTVYRNLNILKTYTNINAYTSLFNTNNNYLFGLVSESSLGTNILRDPDFGASTYANILTPVDWETDPQLDSWAFDSGVNWSTNKITIPPSAIGTGFSKDFGSGSGVSGRVWMEYSFNVIGTLTTFDWRIMKGGLQVLQGNTGTGGAMALPTAANDILRIERQGDPGTTIECNYLRIFPFSPNWSFNNEWRIQGSPYVLTKTAGTSKLFYAGPSFTTGIVYKVVIDVGSITSGSLLISFGTDTAEVFTTGKHTFYLTPTTTVVDLENGSTPFLGTVKTFEAFPAPYSTFVSTYEIVETQESLSLDMETEDNVVSTTPDNNCLTEDELNTVVQTLDSICCDSCSNNTTITEDI